MAQYDNHETDLYVLPKSPEEAKAIIKYIREDVTKRLKFTPSHHWQASNVPNQPWHGRCFIEIPCGTYLREEMEAKFPTAKENTDA